MISSLAIPAALRKRIADEAVKAFPAECCGLIEGTRDFDMLRAAAVHPTRNVAQAPDRFEIDPAEHIRLLRAAREKGRTIIGCYHSHPNGKTEPSQADRANASGEDFLWLIAALGTDRKPRLSAFVYAGGAFAPIHLAGRLARAKAAKV
jgi:proteasome lid subunit RPN8/RPN11